MNAMTTQSRLPVPTGTSVSPEQWRVLTEAIFPNAKTAEAIVLALDYCRARKLDVFKRPVHIVPMWSKQLRRDVETVWPGINELQITAARTHAWAGMDAPEWGPMRVTSFTMQSDNGSSSVVKVEHPEWCSVTVWRIVAGQRFAFCEPVYWMECYGRMGRSNAPNDMWRKRPRGQVHKNAKAASLRAAFPEEMGNDYTSEEMEGQMIETVASTPRMPNVVEHDAMQSLDASEDPPAPALPAPLDHAGPDKNDAAMARLLARIAACATVDDLHEVAGDEAVYKGLTAMRITRPDLVAQYENAMRAAYGARPDLLFTPDDMPDAADAVVARDDMPDGPWSEVAS